jgi:hypothetical protein
MTVVTIAEKRFGIDSGVPVVRHPGAMPIQVPERAKNLDQLTQDGFITARR